MVNSFPDKGPGWDFQGRNFRHFCGFVISALILTVLFRFVYFHQVVFHRMRAFLDSRRLLVQVQGCNVTEPVYLLHEDVNTQTQQGDTTNATIKMIEREVFEEEPVPGETINTIIEMIEREVFQEEPVPGETTNTTIEMIEREVFEEEPVPGEKHIICLETRCLLNKSASYNHKGLLLHPRQACSLESAARMNPDYKVYLLYSCPVNGTLEDSEEYVKAVLAYPNVKLWMIHMEEHIMGTPLENWDFHTKVSSSRWPNEHASDVLRYLTLWKYGGTYMDMDVIVLKSFDDLPSNYVGKEFQNSLASGVMNFAHEGLGYEVATRCLEELSKNFRGDIWAHNGPGVITRVMYSICGVPAVEAMTEEKCKGFNLLPPEVFYAIPYTQWRHYFAESNTDAIMQKIANSSGAHFWNKMSRDEPVRVGSNQIFSLISESSCPGLFENVGDIM